jgi:hypothetical protein
LALLRGAEAPLFHGAARILRAFPQTVKRGEDPYKPGEAGVVSKRPVIANFLEALVAIILGNAVYFLLMPHLPAAARHHRFQVDLGTVVDFWFCLVAYGLVRTVRRWR